MASIFESLAVNGHRLSSGAANASGKCWVYKPGTTSPAAIYGDADEHPQTNPVTLSAGGKAQIYFKGKVDVYFQDVNGVGIETLTLSERAERVEVRNAGFTGLLPSGSQGGGGATNLDTVLSSLYASVGGLDGMYKEYTGATARKVHDVLQGIQISVKDYGAVGNGVADDTIPISNAVNECARLGGGRVYFDPGTYITSSPILLSSKAGVSFEGAGPSASIIKTSGSANAFTLTGCSGFFIRGIGITSAATSPGTALALSGCSNYVIELVTIGTSGGGTFLVCASVSGASSKTVFENCVFTAKSADATARGIAYSTSSGSGHQILNCTLDGQSGQCLNFDGTSGSVFMANCATVGAMTFAATLTGNGFQICGCAFASAPVFSVASDLIISQAGNSWPANVQGFAVGGSVTPQVMSGVCHLSATSGGAGAVAVNIPSPTLSVRQPFFILFTNNSGGNVTWNLNAAYKTGGAPSALNGNTTIMGFMVDVESGGFREMFRGTTTT